jgi:hypothetical protein
MVVVPEEGDSQLVVAEDVQAVVVVLMVADRATAPSTATTTTTTTARTSTDLDSIPISGLIHRTIAQARIKSKGEEDDTATVGIS